MKETPRRTRPSPTQTSKQRVSVVTPDLGLAAAGALGQWVPAAHDFVTYRSAIFAVQAKILGALSAKDDNSEAMNVADHVDLVRKMFGSLRALLRLVATVEKQLMDVLGREALTETLANIQAQLNDDAWPFDDRLPFHLRSRIRSRVQELTASDLNIIPQLRMVSNGLAKLTHSIATVSARNYLERNPLAPLGKVLAGGT